MTRPHFSIAWGICLLLALGAAGCHVSPQQHLERANNQLSDLTTSDARHYISLELQRLATELDNAESLLRANNYAESGQRVRGVLAALDSLSDVYARRKALARDESMTFLRTVSLRVDSIEVAVSAMPAQTYADQNHRDIVRMRISELKDRMQGVRAAVEARNFPLVRNEAPHIDAIISNIFQEISHFAKSPKYRQATVPLRTNTQAKPAATGLSTSH